MVGILEFFSAPGFQKPFKADYTQPHWIVGIVYKLHTMTGSLLFFASCTIFIKELMHDHIHCIQDTNGDESKVCCLFSGLWRSTFLRNMSRTLRTGSL